MRVVPALHVPEQIDPGSGEVPEAGLVEQLAFEAGEEALGHGVVAAVADGAHRERDAGIAAALPEGQGRVLTALIGVMDDVLRPAHRAIPDATSPSP